MVTKIIIIVFHTILLLGFCPTNAQTWIRAGYYRYTEYDVLPISDINSALFTHLIFAFADVNSTTYQLSITPDDEKQFAIFTDTVKESNPSVTTLLSIGGIMNHSTFTSMVSNRSHRKSFIDSSINMARLFRFQGLDLSFYPNTSSDMFNMGILFGEWRAATILEAKKSRQSQLILTAAVMYSPHYFDTASYPIDSIRQYLNWVHVLTAEYKTPNNSKLTGAHAALYDPSSDISTDYGIRAWIDAGLPSNKLVFCLPFYGYAWKLANPKKDGIGAPATGPVMNKEGTGLKTYKQIKSVIKIYGANVTYNASYVVKYCTTRTAWICFDDEEVVRIKISYAKAKRLLGYYVWLVSFDDNWVLSKAAAEVDNKNGPNKWPLLEIALATIAAVIMVLGFLLYYFWVRKLKLKGKMNSAAKQSNNKLGDFVNNVPNLLVYTSADIEEATDRFSFQNKLGEGGFGPVYKGVLPSGQEIAVKKLAKTSTQGFEEFKNEVMLTAKLQHVNLVRLLGFSIDRAEQMLIYEYMPNRSLDFYLFDPIRRYILDWKKRVHIIEGVTQGLLYLQEYSRLTIIHRDLKVSNILLDETMQPKISDFGMARIFIKNDIEANTRRIVGTIGYASPEYLKRGTYSTKSDVYSFGVLLLQIISGKRISFLYGINESLSLLDYAYELWKDGKGIEFMDESLNDTYSLCKLMRCLQIALLCVQENPIDRPSMLEVSSMLKDGTTDISIPNKPAFSKQNDGCEGKKSALQSESLTGSTSTYDITISEVVAR